MQIHFALSEPPSWEGDDRLGAHRDRPPDAGARRRLARGERGRARAPAGGGDGRRRPAADDGPVAGARADAGLLWIQLQELPWHVKGDAAGELDAEDGTWTDELRERYADRIQARIAAHVPNLESAIRKRVVLSPADLQAANVNLHHGDTVLRLARPRPEPALAAVRRPARDTRLRFGGCGRSAPARIPAPGLGAGSGTLVAKRLLEPPLLQRIRSRIGG